MLRIEGGPIIINLFDYESFSMVEMGPCLLTKEKRVRCSWYFILGGFDYIRDGARYFSRYGDHKFIVELW